MLFVADSKFRLSRIEQHGAVILILIVVLNLARFQLLYAQYNLKWLFVYVLGYSLGALVKNQKEKAYVIIFFLVFVIFECILSISNHKIILLVTEHRLTDIPLILKGSFSNSSMLSFISSLALILSIYLFKISKKKQYKLLLLVGGFILLLTIMLTASRASILACVLGIFMLSKIRRIYILIAASMLLVYFFTFKKDSIDGRLLIWKVSSTMIQDNIWLGVGFNRFAAEYNNYQSEYFTKLLDNYNEAVLADNSFYSFNLILKIVSEYGVIGLIVFLFYGYFIWKSIKRNKLANAIFISTICFAMFSYPFEQIEVCFILFVFLGLARREAHLFDKTLIVKNKFTVKSIIITIVFILMISEINSLKNIKLWEKFYNYKYYSPGLSLHLISGISKKLEGYPEFTYSYGSLLNENNLHHEAIYYLEMTKNRLPTSELYTLLGISYSNIGENRLAVKSHYKAINMVPSLFVPKYYLFKFYEENNDNLNALKLAKTIVDQKVKVKNEIIFEIKKECSIFIDEF